MNTHEFYVKEDETNLSYFIEFYKAPMLTELLYRFWHWIDPCCRKPYWFWSRFVFYYYNTINRRDRYSTGTLQVERSWAIKHYDWDVLNYERGADDG